MTSRSRRSGTVPTVENVPHEGGVWESTQGWSERAQAALAEKNRAAIDEHARNSQKLAARMQEVVGVDVKGLPLEKYGDTIILDSVTFRLLQYEPPTGAQLVILRPCGRCGKATSSALLKTLLDVAEALEEWDPQCRDCQKGASAPAVEPAPA